MNWSLRTWYLVGAACLVFAALVTLWVDLAHSGQSGMGRLLAPGLPPAEADHLYGGKMKPARMFYENLCYLALILQLLAALLLSLGKAARFVMVAAALGALVGVHRCALLLIDQRPTWMLDLGLSVVALAACGVAMAASRRLERAVKPP